MRSPHFARTIQAAAPVRWQHSSRRFVSGICGAFPGSRKSADRRARLHPMEAAGRFPAYCANRRMKVLFFAQIRDFTGCEAANMETRGNITADAVWEQLEEEFPGIEKFRGTTRLARNGVFAAADEQFAESDEVALIPPVSGG